MASVSREIARPDGRPDVRPDGRPDARPTGREPVALGVLGTSGTWYQTLTRLEYTGREPAT